MESVCKELDEVKAEMEKLKSEYRIKTEFSDSLKRVHSEQLLKLQEAKQQIEQQAQDLNVKSEEISEARRISEVLKSSLYEKESSLRHLSSVNEKLRADSRQDLQKLEGENRELVLALDEVTTRNKELEQNVCASNKEIEGLKRLVMVTEKKCFEVEQRAQEAKEVRQRDDMILKLEEENRDVQDQLKWKKEQFKHLEEAHKRLQDQFQLSKEEWERGKSALLQEISSLQTSLDSQTRILGGLQTRLEMCNQALAHEESKRKFMEVQVSEFKSRFDDAFTQCEEEKSKIQSLTIQRDEEIARLRNSLGRKETFAKEMEIRIVHLEQENQELGESLKELREAQIRNVGSKSLIKLGNKLRGLEQVHSKCSKNLKAKESEWSFQVEKMKRDIDSYKFELKDKEELIRGLQMELESCHSTIQVLNGEISLVLLVFKSEFSEAYSKIFNEKVEMELHNKEKEDKISLLKEQLELNKSSINKPHLDHMQEHEELASLRKKIESLEHMQVFKEDEIQRHKRTLDESSKCQFHLRKQLLQMESALKENRRDDFEALEKANLELAEKIHEVGQLKYELQNWKFKAESLKVCIEENQEACKKMETSLLAQAAIEQILKNEKEILRCNVEEKDKQIEDLQQQIVLLEAKIAVKTQEVEAFVQDREYILRIVEEKDSCIENLQKDITCLKQESMRKEAEAAVLGRRAAERAFEQEKESILQIMNDKDQNIKDLRILAMSMEQDLEGLVVSSFSEVIEKHIQINFLSEAIKNAENLTNVEIEEKNKVIVTLEEEVCSLQQKLAFEEESFFQSKQQAQQLQALLEANKLENAKFMDEQRSMEGLVKELKLKNEVLLQDSVIFSTEREDLLVCLEEICDRMGEFSGEDVKLMKILGRISHSEEGIGSAMDLMVHSEFNDPIRENANTCVCSTTKKLEEGADERLPLKEVNNLHV